MKRIYLLSSVLVILWPALFVWNNAEENHLEVLEEESKDVMSSWVMTSVAWKDIPQPADNPITQEKVELGAKLFFDPRLSGSNMMSCATCHHPKMGFSDREPLFLGDTGHRGPRRSQSAQNLAWATTFFWDGRASSLEEQAMMPITSPEEMNQEVRQLLAELREAGYYPYFQKAFGMRAQINMTTISQAIASFERTLVSVNSPFDRYMSGDRTAMNASQIRGKEVFETKGQCITCHFGPNFTDDGFHNIGIDTTDAGRYNLLPIPFMKYAFKTPGLRDIAFRAPYFHNGSAATLEEVVELYDEGGRDFMRDLPNIAIQPLGLTIQEKRDLVAFMEALTGTGVYDYPVPSLPVHSTE